MFVINEKVGELLFLPVLRLLLVLYNTIYF